MLITISNLFPRPDQPTRGLYNFRLFREVAAISSISHPASRSPLKNTNPIQDGSAGTPRPTEIREFSQGRAKPPAEPGASIQHPASSIQYPVSNDQNPATGMLNICLVPEWRVWRWPAIRKWKMGMKGFRVQGSGEHREKNEGLNAEAVVPSIYLPVFYLPVIGRSINWWFYARALRAQLSGCSVDKLLSESPKDTPPSTTQQPSNLTTDHAARGVILAPWLYPDGIAAAQLAREHGVRLWLMALGSDTFHLGSPVRRRKVLEACAQAEGVICVAQVLADRLAAAGVPMTKLHVVPNGVDTSLFRYRSKDEAWSELEKSVAGGIQNPESRIQKNEAPDMRSLRRQIERSQVILFVGNLVPIKGPDVMLKAFAVLQGKMQDTRCRMPDDPLPPTSSIHHPVSIIPLPASSLHHPSSSIQPPASSIQPPASRIPPPASRIHLLLIGSGPMQGQLEQLAHDLGLSSCVHFLGRRSPEEVARWMNIADVLCLSSHSEGMPNVVLEARASGLPVVTTQAGAIPELPLNREHFLVVKSCSPGDLAEGLRVMLARETTARKPDPAIYTWADMAGKVLGLMRGEGRAPSP